MGRWYFVDESGNSGDLVRAGTAFDFGAQPVFCLACFGDDDPASLNDAVGALKSRHRVQSAELKASRLYGRPEFLKDILTLLRERGAPVFIEVVEKRYAVAVHLVNHQLLASRSDAHDDPIARLMAQALVEFIACEAPDSVLRAFLHACDAPTFSSVAASLEGLSHWAANFQPAFELTEIVEGLARLGLEQMEDTEEVLHPYSYMRLLPSPDPGPSGKPLWMLPSLSSFTNIYARINLSHRRRLSDVTIVHDQQRYYAQAIANGKASAEKMMAMGVQPITPFADYGFIEEARLEFAASCDHTGLQIADLLAGIVTRYMARGPNAAGGLAPVFKNLLAFTDARTGTGLNFLATDRTLAAVGVGAGRI